MYMDKAKMTDEQRQKAISDLTKHLAEGGWSSIYNFVETHVEDWELDIEDEEEEEDDSDNG